MYGLTCLIWAWRIQRYRERWLGWLAGALFFIGPRRRCPPKSRRSVRLGLHPCVFHHGGACIAGEKHCLRWHEWMSWSWARRRDDHLVLLNGWDRRFGSKSAIVGKGCRCAIFPNPIQEWNGYGHSPQDGRGRVRGRQEWSCQWLERDVWWTPLSLTLGQWFLISWPWCPIVRKKEENFLLGNVYYVKLLSEPTLQGRSYF